MLSRLKKQGNIVSTRKEVKSHCTKSEGKLWGGLPEIVRTKMGIRQVLINVRESLLSSKERSRGQRKVLGVVSVVITDVDVVRVVLRGSEIGSGKLP